MTHVSIQLMGGFHARLEDSDELLFPTRKARMLCAFLAYPAGTSHSRDRLASLFWGSRGDEQARGSLRNALTSIRRLLGADVVQVEKDMVALNADFVSVDVDLLTSLLNDATRPSLERALSLYLGPFLQDIPEGEEEFDDWVRRERTYLDDTALHGFTTLMEMQLDGGAYTDGIETSRTALAIDPLQEQTHRLLMQLYDKNGQRGLALRQYDELRRLLANELGIEPDADTRDLVYTIKAGAPKDKTDGRTDIDASAGGHIPVTPIDRPSIAVLPFETLGGDDQSSFADGIVEEITAALSRVRAFFVIARNSSATFKGTELPVSKIAERLGVRYLLTGSVRRAAGRLRIATQLLDAESAEQLWTENFEGGDQDIFDLQDRITEEVVGILQPTILAAEVSRARRKRPGSLQAYDLTHRAFPHVWTMTFEDNQKALELLREARKLDPGYALALALASWCHAQNITYNWTGDIEPAKERALALARDAFQLDSADPLVLTTLSTAESLTKQHDIARIHIDRALKIDRNSAWAWLRSGWIHCYDGNFEKSIEHFERAWRLSPYDPLNFNLCFGIGLSHFALGQNERAAQLIEQGLLENPSAVWANRPLVSIYAWMDEPEKAQAAMKRTLDRYPDLTVTKIMDSIPHRAPDMVARYTAGLRKAGFPE